MTKKITTSTDYNTNNSFTSVNVRSPNQNFDIEFENLKYNSLLDEYIQPDPRDIASLIAIKNNWTIVPGGDFALNLIGLSTQVPSTLIYGSTGPNTEYIVNSTIQIKFLHTKSKNIQNLPNFKTAVVIQAILCLGETQIDNNVIAKMSILFDFEQKQQLIAISRQTSSWIGTILLKIAEF